MEQFNTIILGFGKVGKTLAGYLAGKGLKVAVIEKDERMYGGTCINVGCIPTKFLVHKALFAKEHKTIEAKEEYYYESIIQKKAFITKLRGVNYHKLADNQNIKIFTGEGSFVDSHTIEVKTGTNSMFISAEEIYINTGSKSFVPPIQGIDSKFVYTSDSLLDLEKLPRNLVIIGGGNIGLEFANFYADFGSTVTILSNENTFMGREDAEVAEEVLKVFADKKIKVELSVKVIKIEENKVRYSVNDIEYVVEGDAILVATGRVPNTQSLKLDKAGVLTNNRGGIVVNHNLKTSVENIYALGDCNGGAQFTYVSLDDFRIIKSNKEGGNYDLSKRKNVPYSVFIEPSLGRVGFNEKQALDLKLDYRVLKVSMNTHPKAKILQDDKGFIKLIIDNKTHLILGATLLCEEAYELVNYIKLAMDHDIVYEDIINTIYTHPTMSEAFNDLK